jgi:hypothetical protein
MWKRPRSVSLREELIKVSTKVYFFVTSSRGAVDIVGDGWDGGEEVAHARMDDGSWLYRAADDAVSHCDAAERGRD